MEKLGEKISGWQEAVELAVVIWLFISPAILGFFDYNAATLVAMGLAIAAILTTQLGIAKQEPWAEWLNLILALFLVLSPWIFGYSAMLLATWNAVAAGAVLALFAVWAMVSEYAEMHRYKHGQTH